jgi:hypothetical protein
MNYKKLFEYFAKKEEPIIIHSNNESQEAN